MKRTSDLSNIEKQKLDLIKLRIKNKFYDRDEILQSVVKEIYIHDLKKEN